MSLKKKMMSLTLIALLSCTVEESLNVQPLPHAVKTVEETQLVPISKGERDRIRLKGQIFSAFKVNETTPPKVPVSSATFSILNVSSQSIFESITNSNGEFIFEQELPDGLYSGTIRADLNGQQLVQKMEPFTIANAKTTQPLNFVIGTGAIKGTVTLENLTVHADITVQILNSNIPPAKTDTQGRFTIYNVPQVLLEIESKEIMFSKEGFESQIIKVDRVLAGQDSVLEPVMLKPKVTQSNPDPMATPVPNVNVNIDNSPTININPEINVNPEININPTPSPTPIAYKTNSVQTLFAQFYTYNLDFERGGNA